MQIRADRRQRAHEKQAKSGNTRGASRTVDLFANRPSPGFPCQPVRPSIPRPGERPGRRRQVRPWRLSSRPARTLPLLRFRGYFAPGGSHRHLCADRQCAPGRSEGGRLSPPLFPLRRMVGLRPIPATWLAVGASFSDFFGPNSAPLKKVPPRGSDPRRTRTHPSSTEIRLPIYVAELCSKSVWQTGAYDSIGKRAAYSGTTVANNCSAEPRRTRNRANCRSVWPRSSNSSSPRLSAIASTASTSLMRGLSSRCAASVAYL